MDKNTNILITGGNGFLGTSLVENLRARGYWNLKTFSSSEFNLVNKDDTEKLFAFYSPDIVIHLAAKVGGIGANQKNPGKFCYENLAMGMNVIETARQHNIKKLIIAATICSYAKFTSVPFKEEDLWNGFQEQFEIRPGVSVGNGPYKNFPEETNASYGLGKRMLLVLAQAYRQQYGLNTVVLFPVNLFGEGDHTI
jgi:GDP-L-fucose synthase